MATPFTADQPFKENNVINESERDSGTPANDSGKLAQLESNGLLSKEFLPGSVPLLTYTLNESGTWSKPSRGNIARIYIWGAGGGGQASKDDAGSPRGAVGGTGGAFGFIEVPFYLLDSSIGYIIGEGGDGGVASTDTNLIDGSDGAETSFGDYISAAGGEGGSTLGGPAIGNSNVLSDDGFLRLQIVQGGQSGSYVTGGPTGGNITATPDQKYAGAGGGTASTDGDGVFNTSPGGENLLLGFVGGEGASENTAASVGEAGEATCGGGAAFTRTGATATGGKGGDGYIYIEIF